MSKNDIKNIENDYVEVSNTSIEEAIRDSHSAGVKAGKASRADAHEEHVSDLSDIITKSNERIKELEEALEKLSAAYNVQKKMMLLKDKLLKNSKAEKAKLLAKRSKCEPSVLLAAFDLCFCLVLCLILYLVPPPLRDAALWCGPVIESTRPQLWTLCPLLVLLRL